VYPYLALDSEPGRAAHAAIARFLTGA
jgi:hypothetical protein